MIPFPFTRALHSQRCLGSLRQKYFCWHLMMLLMLAVSVQTVFAQPARAETAVIRFAYNIVDPETEPGKAVTVLEPISAPWKTQALEANRIQEWTTTLTQALRASGYPIAYVIVTQDDAQQAYQTGLLRFTVYLGAIGKLDLHNSSRTKDSRLLNTIEAALCNGEHPIGQGCVLQSDRLERATQLLQDIPGVTLGKAPSLDDQEVPPGQTHLSVETVPIGDPWRIDAIADNQGSQATGLLRLGATVSANNLLGHGDAYSASIYTTNKQMWSGTLGASAPLGHHGLRWSLAAGRSFYSINPGILVNGVADTFSAGVTYPFVRGLDLNVYGALDAVETRTTASYPDYNLSLNTRLHALRATLSANNGDRPQQLGLNIWQARAAFTLGDQENNDSSDVGPHRAGHYVKFAASLLRKQNLSESGNLFAIANLRGQVANKNLDYSEMLSLGGYYAVRAYRSDEGSANQGFIASFDLKSRFPAPGGGQLLPGAFVDFALGQLNRHPWNGWQAGYPTVPNVSNRRFLAGYGLSLDWVSPWGFTTSIAWARRFPFAQESWIQPGSANSRVWVNLSWQH
ncbi:ShlB/FhaC/HecB family hemolysin secretion/activation protein [Cupriavidus necator]